MLGHEAAGIVERVGADVRYVQPGDHVITCLSAFCGHCEHCLTGHLVRCSGLELHRDQDQQPCLFQGEEKIHQFLNVSAFAEYMLVHEHALVKIRRDMPLDRAALIGCCVITGVGAVVHTAKVEMGSNRFRVDMPRLVEIYLNGKLYLDDLIAGHVKLQSVNDCFAQLRSSQVTRNVIVFE